MQEQELKKVKINSNIWITELIWSQDIKPYLWKRFFKMTIIEL